VFLYIYITANTIVVGSYNKVMIRYV